MKKVVILAALALGTAGTIALAAQDPQAPQRGYGKGAMLERLKAADANADGLLSRAEAAALPRLAERFDQLDANQDGQVSFDELHAGRRGKRGGMMKAADTDGDGKVSKAEMLARAEARFERADANKDGFITPDEVRQGRRHGHGHGHRHGRGPGQ